MWGTSARRRRRPECDPTPVRSEKRRPAQQVHPQIGEQEPVGGDPANRLHHVEGLGDEVRCTRRSDPGSQRGAQGFGLLAETAGSELAPLVRHVRQHGLDGGGAESMAQQQAGDQEERDRRNREAQVRQRELRQ